MNTSLHSPHFLTDALGSSRQLTYASAYDPYGTVTSTDRTYTGQRDVTGTGLMDYNFRMYSPSLGRFISPDNIIPGMAISQSWNRYSYVLNNPVNANDPSGHKCVGEAGECLNNNGKTGGGFTGKTTTTPNIPLRKLPNNPNSDLEHPHNNEDHRNHNTGEGKNDYDVTSSGEFAGGISGGGGGLLADGYLTGVGPDGECQEGTGGQSVCTFAGGNIPLRYIASYDISIYQDLMSVTIHENYWMPGFVWPLGDTPTFGQSQVLSLAKNGQLRMDMLGEFENGNTAHPERMISRDTTIYFNGKENFPTDLQIFIVYGADAAGKSIKYNLPKIPY
jgi:RHS repeat-associated protein